MLFTASNLSITLKAKMTVITMTYKSLCDLVSHYLSDPVSPPHHDVATLSPCYSSYKTGTLPLNPLCLLFLCMWNMSPQISAWPNFFTSSGLFFNVPDYTISNCNPPHIPLYFPSQFFFLLSTYTTF